MNIPNILTIIRTFVIPFFVLFITLGKENAQFNWFALIIFLLACTTDALDGKIARKFNQITNFGKFADPLADKILVTSAMLCLIDLKSINLIAVIVILSREFAVTCLRLVASSNGKVIPANFFGKIKTVTQMLAIFFGLLNICIPKNLPIVATYESLIALATIATTISGSIYIWQNRNFLAT